MSSNTSRSTRLMSLDTLRGMDMFFIMGGGAIFANLGNLFPNTFLEVIGKQMGHVEWNGFAFYDLIFPLFLFIAGVSFPFSLQNSQSKGMSKKGISVNIIRRAVILILLGIVYNGFFSFDFENLRIASVLGRIGSAWMLASLFYLWTSRTICSIGTILMLLLYWLLLIFFSAPDYPEASSLSLEGNIVGYIDRLLLPGVLHLEIHDPEGILSTLPAACTAMMGILTGDYIKNNQQSGHVKSLMMLMVGIALLIVGWIFNEVFPINKNLWTSSFALVSAGWSVVSLSICYWIVDVMKWQRWTFFFRVIGMNSICIYLAQEFIGFHVPTKAFFEGLIHLLPANLYGIAYSTGYTIICWIFLYFLYRNKLFFKV